MKKIGMLIALTLSLNVYAGCLKTLGQWLFDPAGYIEEQSKISDLQALVIKAKALSPHTTMVAAVEKVLDNAHYSKKDIRELNIRIVTILKTAGDDVGVDKVNRIFGSQIANAVVSTDREQNAVGSIAKVALLAAQTEQAIEMAFAGSGTTRYLELRKTWREGFIFSHIRHAAEPADKKLCVHLANMLSPHLGNTQRYVNEKLLQYDHRILPRYFTLWNGDGYDGTLSEIDIQENVRLGIRDKKIREIWDLIRTAEQ